MQHDWSKKSASEQQQSVRALRELLALLRPCDIGKFLPQVTRVTEMMMIGIERFIRVIVMVMKMVIERGGSDRDSDSDREDD